MARVAAELELGAPTAQALGAMRARLRSERVDSLASALLSQQIAGGDVAGLMRRLAAAAADRDRVDDEARAATTQARFTGLLVVAMPAGAAVFAELIQPGFISRVLAEPASAAMLIAAGGLQLAGFALIRRLGRPTE
jgi:tight adherence protein B